MHLDAAGPQTLSDALDKCGINGQCHRIKPRSTEFRMAGRAWTLLYGPAGKPSGTVGDYIDDVAPGSVIVLDNGGRENATVWGDILTEIASNQIVRPHRDSYNEFHPLNRFAHQRLEQVQEQQRQGR